MLYGLAPGPSPASFEVVVQTAGTLPNHQQMNIFSVAVS